jgi:hypothetical protein
VPLALCRGRLHSEQQGFALVQLSITSFFDASLFFGRLLGNGGPPRFMQFPFPFPPDSGASSEFGLCGVHERVNVVMWLSRTPCRLAVSSDFGRKCGNSSCLNKFFAAKPSETCGRSLSSSESIGLDVLGARRAFIKRRQRSFYGKEVLDPHVSTDIPVFIYTQLFYRTTIAETYVRMTYT